MDAQRAQEICSSSQMANVTYNGERIYIEHVDQDKAQATIHPIDQPTNKQSVAVSSLIEE